MKLRRQLALVSLITLCLPWAGCQTIQQMEVSLQKGQAGALLATAQAVAARLGDEPSLLRADKHRYDDPRQQLYATSLPATIIVDGYDDEWRSQAIEARHFEAGKGDASRDALKASAKSAFYEDTVYLFVTVEDRDIQYHHPGRDEIANGDHLLINSGSGLFYIRNSAPGPVSVVSDTGSANHGIAGVWVENKRGYQLELKMPRSLTLNRFSLNVVDQSGDFRRRLSFFEQPAHTGEQGLAGSLMSPLPPLSDAIGIFRQPGLRLRIINHNGWRLADTGKPDRSLTPGSSQANWVLTALYKAALQSSVRPPRPQNITGSLAGPEIEQALSGLADTHWYQQEQQQLGSAAAPIYYHNNGYEVIGVVIAERSNNVLAALTNSVFSQLLLLTMGAAIVVGAGLLGYASWLSLRIRRISKTAQQSVSNDGQIQTNARNWPSSSAGDELDELSQQYHGLLMRLQAHTDYLKTLANKLSHELRTPLAVVRSSLDNLEQEAVDNQAGVYLERARSGAERLSSLLTAISEASRVESSIQGAECKRFPLDGLILDLCAAYRDIHPDYHIDLTLADKDNKDDFLLFGSPDLIAQLLDKLMDNAIDFSSREGQIQIELRKLDSELQFSVSNKGPLLPAHMQDQLFDSLVSLREGSKQSGTHMGLGLHIVRLVAQFHGGSARAENLPDESGVIFTITLPKEGLGPNFSFAALGG